jgi:VanZ family protein
MTDDKARYLARHWLPVFIWMAVIFLFSSQPHSGAITATYFGNWNVPVRKGAHLCEYFLLSLLAERAFRLSGGFCLSHAKILALLLSALYALSDEWHQSFVPGRTATINDAFVDIGGALLAICFLTIRAKLTCQKQSDHFAQ